MFALIRIFSIFIFVVVFAACQSNKPNQQDVGNKDDILTGDLHVAVDESIFPLIQEQVDIFQESYPNSKVILHAAPEIMSVNLMLSDKAQIGLLTRELTSAENQYFLQRNIKPRIFTIGYDGIILVNHISSADTSIGVSDISKLLKGAHQVPTKLVFDNLNSSALRFLKDFSDIEKVSSNNVVAEENLDGVFNKIITDVNSIGVMSLNQYLNMKQTFAEFDKIRILSVRNDVEKLEDNLYHKPSQSTLATGTYPFRRPIFILNYQPNTGLGIGFSAFLYGDRGQRIVLKSGLLPETMPGRELIIRDKIN